MFPKQHALLKSAPIIRQALAGYQWRAEPSNWLEIAESKAGQFVIPVPLVGAFSSGKSTLINALLGEKIFSTNIDPETAVPAEIVYGAKEAFFGIYPDGSKLPLSREDVRENRLGALHKGGYLEVTLPAANLEKLQHLRLVDMPGWDSGIEAHSTAIDNYASRSLAYGVAVSADEGNLRDSIRRALKELAIGSMPVFAVVTKADKKPEEDVAAVLHQVELEIVATMGKPPIMAVSVSARKAQITGFVAALQALEVQAEPLFADTVIKPVVSKLHNFCAHLDTLLNKDDLDSEKIDAESKVLLAQMQKFQAKLDDETATLDARVAPVLSKIMSHLKACLSEQAESFAETALRGGDLQGELGIAVRQAVAEGIRDEFEPEITRYVGRIADSLPESFSPEINQTFNFENKVDQGMGSAGGISAILAAVLPLLKLTGKGGMIAAAVIAVVGLLENLFASSRKKEVEAAHQREEAFQAIIGKVIPDVIGQVRGALESQLHEHIKAAKMAIVNQAKAQQQSHEAALADLQAKLAQGKEAFDKACAQHQTTKTAIIQIIDELEAA